MGLNEPLHSIPEKHCLSVGNGMWVLKKSGKVISLGKLERCVTKIKRVF